MTDLLAPLPGAPAGTSARYEPAFLRLSDEVAKLTAVDAGIPDWDQVASDAAEVLATLSKDLLAAVYYARALAERDGLAGLHAGLEVVRGILTTYWDDGFPAVSRPAARAAALRWLGEGLPGLSGEPAALTTCATLIGELETLCAERLPGEDLGLAQVRQALVPTAGDTPRPSRTQAQTTSSASNSGAPRDRLDALRLLREGGAWFTAHEPHSPVGLLVQRAIAMAGKPFDEVFRDLLTNHQAAQQELWQVLGLPPPP